MNIISKLTKPEGTLTATAMAITLLAACPAEGQIVFDDGKMHVISDATYATERIEVRNGSRLRITDGAVISALLGPNSEFAIQVFDNSLLIVQGGSFGGAEAFSGAIAAFDQSLVTIADGTFGKDGSFRSGMISVLDDANLNISGGTFTSADGSGGRIETYDNGRANISDGNFGAQIHAMGRSIVAISGGRFGKDNPGGSPPFFRGAIFARDTATVKISGGAFGVGTGFVVLSGALTVEGAAQAKISGGTFTGNPAFGNGVVLVQSPDAAASIAGGHFDGTEIHVVAGQATIDGCAFNLPFGPVSDLNTTLQGVLSNGDVIDAILTRDDANALIDLVEDCDL